MTRKEHILKLIVEHFIQTAEPLGSVTLMEKYNLPFSSATIRNDMSDLEAEGYIEKTHTSSGRVPSAKGYKYYIEFLRSDQLDDVIKHKLTTVFKDEHKAIDDIIRESCEILSSMTNLTSIVMGNDSKNECLNKIQLIPLNETSAVAVFVTTKGRVEYKNFAISATNSIEDIQNCIDILNDRLVGTSIDKVIEKMEALRPILNDYMEKYQVLFNTILETVAHLNKDEYSVYGSEKILDQPEFTTSKEKIKKMFKLIENDKLFNLVKNQNERINVLIGEEIESDLDDDVTLISTTIDVDNEVKTIALLGPTRMDYQKAISAMVYLAEQIGLLGKDKEE